MKKFICVTYSGNTESFRWEQRNGDGEVLSQGTISFSDNSLGYFLCQLLDLNIEDVIDLVDTYELDGHPRLWMHARNEKEVYEQLMEYSEVYRLYEPEEHSWIRHFHDACHPAFPHFLDRLWRYLAYCEREQLPYHGEFFYFLLGNNYFGEKLDLRYQDDIPPMNTIFLESTRDFRNLEDLDAHRAIFLEEKAVNQQSCSRTYTVSCEDDRFAITALASLRELSLRGKVVRKCANCGRYFVPENRSDTRYCDRISPQEPTMDCKTYASQRLWYQKQKQDELAVLSRNILSAKGMLAKRNPDIPAYQRSYDYFRAERMKWKKAVESGEVTRESYREWLLKMQEQKIIKEAFDGID